MRVLQVWKVGKPTWTKTRLMIMLSQQCVEDESITLSHIVENLWRADYVFPSIPVSSIWERQMYPQKFYLLFFALWWCLLLSQAGCVIGAFGGSGNDPGIPSSLGISSSSSPSLSYWRVKSAFVCVSMGLLAWVCAGLSFRAFFSKKHLKDLFCVG
jgi:hypothetical protein